MDSTDAAKMVLLRPLAKALKNEAERKKLANTLREEAPARDSEAVQETNFHYNQSTGEQGIDKMLKDRGWVLHDSGKTGASYKKDGHSIAVQKEGGWSHTEAKKAGKGTATLEAHLKHYFDHKRSDVKKEELELEAKKQHKEEEQPVDEVASRKADTAKYKDVRRGKVDPKKEMGKDAEYSKSGKKGSVHKEETEEITELSKETLTSYKGKAAQSFDKALKKSDGKTLLNRASGIERAIKKIKEARKQEPELIECLGFDTGDITEVTEFPTHSVKTFGGDPFDGNELIAYHNRMMAHHQNLKDLAAGHAHGASNSGDLARWNALVAAHAKHIDAHAEFLQGVNKSGVCVSGDGDGGVGPHSKGSRSFREELLDQ